MAICVEDLTQSHFEPRQWIQGADSTSFDVMGKTLRGIVRKLQDYAAPPLPGINNLHTSMPFEQFSKGRSLFGQDESHQQRAEFYKENILGAVAFAYRCQFHFLLEAIDDSGIQNAERIAVRVASLLDMALEDEPDNRTPINLDSLQNFAEFLIGANLVSYPDIALTPDGNLFALWSAQATQTTLQIVFLQEGIARMLCTRIVSGSPRKERFTAVMGSQLLISFLQTNSLMPN